MIFDEEWRKIPNSDYSISNLGNLRNDKKGKLRNFNLKSNKYINVKIRVNGKIESWQLHRLVVTYFLGPIEEGLVVNHKDANKRNNSLTNLEVCSQSDNIKHAVRSNLYKAKTGEAHFNCKFTDDQVLEIQQIRSTGLYSITFISELFNCSPSTISSICRGTSRKSAFNEALKKDHPKFYPSRAVFSTPEQISILRDIQDGKKFLELRNKYPKLKMGTYLNIKKKKAWKNIWALVEVE